MNELNIYLLDKTNAAPFAPYLLPGVRNDIGAGREIIALGAADETNTLGAVAAVVRNCKLHILCLYVDPAVRRQGVGTVLLTTLGDILRDLEAEINEVCTYYMEEDEDTAAIVAFMEAMQLGELRLNNRLFSVRSAEVHDVRRLGTAFTTDFRDDPHVRPFSAITPEQLAELEADEDVLDCLKPSAMTHGILRQASTIWVEDGHVLGWVLCYQGFDGEIVMTAACNRKGAPVTCFLHLLLSMLNRCYVMLGREYTLYISTINDHAAGLVEKITAGNFHEHRSCFAVADGLPDWLTGGDAEEIET